MRLKLTLPFSVYFKFQKKAVVKWLTAILILGMLIFQLRGHSQFNFGNIHLAKYLEGRKGSLDYAREIFLRIQRPICCQTHLVEKVILTELLANNPDEAIRQYTQLRDAGEELRFFSSTSSYTHLLEGLTATQNGEFGTAIEHYRLFFSQHTFEIPDQVYHAYYVALSQSNDVRQRVVGRRIQTMIEEAGTNKAYSPTYDLNGVTKAQFLSMTYDTSCWEVQSIDYDQVALDEGPIVPVQLSWKNRQDDSVFIENSLIKNLAPNAGFEWQSTETPFPMGYPHTIYPADQIENSRMRNLAEVRPSQLSITAGLKNSSTLKSSSYASNSIKVKPNTTYFVGGYLNSDQGNGGIGFRITNPSSNEDNYKFIKSGTGHTGAWNYYGGIVLNMPSNEFINIWMVNLNASGSVYFDDLLFFEINVPTC